MNCLFPLPLSRITTVTYLALIQFLENGNNSLTHVYTHTYAPTKTEKRKDMLRGNYEVNFWPVMLS